MMQVARPPLRVWGWIAATVALAVVAAVLWHGSDAAATTSTTAPVPAALSGAPGQALTLAWSAPGNPLPDRVVERERVVVGSRDGIAGLDPVTGRQVWHYVRSNARLCGLTAVDRVVVAVFEVPSETHRCDQAVALSAATGVRIWTRNVDFPPQVSLTSTEGTALAVSATGLGAVDPVGDNLRWQWQAPGGCRIADAVAGSSAIAVLVRCGTERGFQLRVLDGGSGKERWSSSLPVPDGGAVELAGADGFVTVAVGDRLEVRSADDGKIVQSIPLPSAAGSAGGAAAEVASGDALVVRAAGTAFSLDPQTGALRWQCPALGLPAVLDGGAAVLVPEQGAFVARDTLTGQERRRSTVAGMPAGGSAAVVGPVVVYRLPGRVLAYR